MTTDGHPQIRPLYFKASQGVETKQFGLGNRKTFTGQSKGKHVWET